MMNNENILDMIKELSIYDLLTDPIVENIYRAGYNGFDTVYRERNKAYTSSNQDIIDTAYKELEEEINEDQFGKLTNTI